MEKVTLRIILKNFFVIEKVKTARKKTLMVKKLFESSIKKNKKTNQTEFRIGKAIMKKGDELYVKWKSYDNSFIKL